MQQEDVVKYFQSLKQLLTIEKREDESQYEIDIHKQSINERKMAGITWYPIFIKSEYYGFADYLCIDIERKYETDAISVFSNGDKVEVFSNNEHHRDLALNGTVLVASGNFMTIQLQVDEAPAWLKDGKIGVNRLFDQHSYEVMENALEYWKDEKLSKEQKRIREILLKEELPSRKKLENIHYPQHLDEAQKAAYLHALETNDVAVIHGPPGTGKTTTLVEIIKSLANRGEKILVCAASNAAVDVLTERLVKAGVKTVRIGNPVKVTEENLKYSLTMQVANHPQYSLVKELHKRADEFYRMANKYQRNFGREEREQRKAILKEAKSLKQQAEAHRVHIQSEVVMHGAVITCTPVVTEHKELREAHFDTLIFDEAGQALEPMTWIPLKKANKVIFSGDHLQLPPTVKSEEAQKQGLGISLMEKTSKVEGISTMLRVQYRMHEKIMQYPSEYFYSGKLQAFEKNRYHQLDDVVLQFVDTAGTGFEEELVHSPFGLRNEGEANVVKKIVKDLIHQYQEKISIGVISPYKQQVMLLKEEFLKNKNVQVQTVDSFQGQEKDVIVISLVRSNEKQDIGFLRDLRRMNVAITRARKKLIVIGDSATISTNNFYQGFIDFVDKQGVYSTAWEWME